MNDAVRQVHDALRARGVDSPIRTFTEPVRSAAAAASKLGCPVGAIANSLVFSAAGSPLLVLASGAHRVDVGRIAAHLDIGRKKVRRADPDLVLRATGQQVGGVAPVGHPRQLPTLVDTWLDRHDRIWAGAGDEHSMFAITCSELVRITRGTMLDVND